jgi:hypothetical protein
VTADDLITAQLDGCLDEALDELFGLGRRVHVGGYRRGGTWVASHYQGVGKWVRKIAAVLMLGTALAAGHPQAVHAQSAAQQANIAASSARARDYLDRLQQQAQQRRQAADVAAEPQRLPSADPYAGWQPPDTSDWRVSGVPRTFLGNTFEAYGWDKTKEGVNKDGLAVAIFQRSEIPGHQIIAVPEAGVFVHQYPGRGAPGEKVGNLQYVARYLQHVNAPLHKATADKLLTSHGWAVHHTSEQAGTGDEQIHYRNPKYPGHEIMCDPVGNGCLHTRPHPPQGYDFDKIDKSSPEDTWGVDGKAKLILIEPENEGQAQWMHPLAEHLAKFHSGKYGDVGGTQAPPPEVQQPALGQQQTVQQSPGIAKPDKQVEALLNSYGWKWWGSPQDTPMFYSKAVKGYIEISGDTWSHAAAGKEDQPISTLAAHLASYGKHPMPTKEPSVPPIGAPDPTLHPMHQFQSGFPTGTKATRAQEAAQMSDRELGSLVARRGYKGPPWPCMGQGSGTPSCWRAAYVAGDLVRPTATWQGPEVLGRGR